MGSPEHTITIYRDKKRKFRWRITHSNGDKIADSGQGYTRRIDLTNALSNFIESLIDTRYELVDETRKPKDRVLSI